LADFLAFSGVRYGKWRKSVKDWVMRFDHGANDQRDRGGAAQRVALARDGGLDACQITFGGRQQILALAGSLRGEIGIAANNQVLAGEIGVGDTGDVALIE